MVGDSPVIPGVLEADVSDDEDVSVVRPPESVLVRIDGVVRRIASVQSKDLCVRRLIPVAAKGK